MYFYTYVHTYIHTYIHAYIHTCIHTYIHTYIQCLFPVSLQYKFFYASYISLDINHFEVFILFSSHHAHIVPGAPSGFDATATSSVSISVSWAEPSEPNGIIVQYNLYYTKQGEQERNRAVPAIPKTNSYMEVLSGLQAFTNYTVSVSAETRIGEGNRTDILTILTHPSISSPPTSVSTEALNSTTIILMWGYPVNPQGVIRGYLITSNASVDVVNVTLATVNNMADQSYTFVDLFPFTTYDFQVAAYSLSVDLTVLDGNYSSAMIRMTDEDGNCICIV